MFAVCLVSVRKNPFRVIRPYRADDGLGGDEGAFLICSFWLVDNPSADPGRGYPLKHAQLAVLVRELIEQ